VRWVSIEADHRDVVRDTPAKTAERTQRAHGHQVRRDERRGESGTTVDEPGQRVLSGRATEVAIASR
jgi:hypothetical protein